MTFSGDVTKAYLVLHPGSCSEATIATIRGELIDRAFIVVREEFRTLTLETVQRLLKDEIGAQAEPLVGRVYIFVVARSKAVSKLQDYAAEKPGAPFFVSSTQSSAASGLLYLFPRMVVDPIPSNAEAQDLINTQLKSVLVKGLTEVAKSKPENPTKWLAEYLLENNPNRPPVTQA